MNLTQLRRSIIDHCKRVKMNPHLYAMISDPAAVYTPEHLFEVVCQVLGVSPELARTRKRYREYSDARAIYCYLADRYTQFSQREIVALFGTNHTMVHHSRKKIEALCAVDPSFRDKVRKAKEILSFT